MVLLEVIILPLQATELCSTEGYRLVGEDMHFKQAQMSDNKERARSEGFLESNFPRWKRKEENNMAFCYLTTTSNTFINSLEASALRYL